MKTARIPIIATAIAVAFIGCSSNPDGNNANAVAPAADAQSRMSPKPNCDPDNGGIKLPDGYCATIFADNLGHARHLTIGDSGEVYVNTWSNERNKATTVAGGFLVVLKDTNADGKADVVERFGTVGGPGKIGGGTGIAIHRGMLYAEVDDRIVRYRLENATAVPASPPETVLSGLPMNGDHTMHPFAIAADGTLYVNSGSASNACQVKNRTLQSPGEEPCRELATRAGIWRYDANKTNQVFSAGERYATGLRNTVALSVAADDLLYAVVHGRDQLADNWPKLFTKAQNNELPAETLVRVQQGKDYGWPRCYFDAAHNQFMLAPEYGGDGKAAGDCAGKERPLVSLPAHWAPESIVFANAPRWADEYRGGAFVAFHGSWNREPAQSGFLVAFVPFVEGGPGTQYREFATGFAGPALPADPSAAAHRPVGLAAGSDGSLYVSDDVKGRIWRITRSR